MVDSSRFGLDNIRTESVDRADTYVRRACIVSGHQLQSVLIVYLYDLLTETV